ncbi:MAG: uroporphyrinogen-III C-methyltransferase [Gammaproteobacteria bacterium]
MTESTPPSPASPSPADFTASSGAARSHRGSGLVLAVVALMALAGLVSAFLLWQRLQATQEELARRSQDTLGKAIEARTLAEQSGALVDSIQARLSVAEVKLSEVTLQRSQLEELMLSVSRSRDDNLIQDLEAAIRLAQQQAQLTGSAQPLISALQAADQRIARAAQPRLNPVQRAIARDIERIQGTSTADLPSLLGRFDDIVRQVDDWPVRNQVGPLTELDDPKDDAPEASGTGPTSAAGEPVSADSPTPPSAPANGSSSDATDMADQGWSRLVAGWNRFWQRLWDDVTREGRELVQVSRIDEPDAMLLAPEQAYLLRENVKLKLLNARLALLSRQTAAVQADLKAVDGAIMRYFDPGHPLVAQARDEVKGLRLQLVSLELPRPDESLAALLVAAGGR